MSDLTGHTINYVFIRLSSGEQVEQTSISANVEDQDSILNEQLQKIALDRQIEINDLKWRALGKH